MRDRGESEPSHSQLKPSTEGSRPTPLSGRQVSLGYPRTIAETGGSVGIWHFFPSIDRYVDGLKEMAEIVGADHVSIGTDQFDAPGCLEDYSGGCTSSPRCCAAASPPEETGKIAGGNYLRIFRAAVS